MTMQTPIDFTFANHGSIVLVHALTDRAKDHVEETFDPDRLTFGDAVAVEPRYAGDLAQALYFEGGFEIAIDGVRADAFRAEGTV